MMVTTLYILCLALLTAPSWSYPSYQDVLPNGNNVNHPCKVNYRWPGLGHENPLGRGTKNAFGEDFRNIGNFKWNTALCRADSDGDGRTNGEELGDPNCEWTPGQIPMTNLNISHPGVCEPLNSPICRGRVDFVDCEVETFKDCAAIKNPQVQSLNASFTRIKIPSTETNYFCMTFDLPTDQDYHLVAHEPIIDNADVLHHILVYGCKSDDSPLRSTPWQCFMARAISRCDIIGIWTVGMPGICYPPNLGFRFGASGYGRVILEAHYHNPMGRSDFTDASGLRLYYQPAQPQFQDLSTLSTGQYMLEIPPGKARVPQVGVCPEDCTKLLIQEPATVYSAINHMHYLGRSMKIELLRNGSLINNITNDEFYSYDNPIEHKDFSSVIKLNPGDEIRTTCVFNSLSTNRWTYFGEGTNDEMCFGFLTVYPRKAIRPIPQASCVSYGRLSFCDRWLTPHAPVSGCHWMNFMNKSHPHNIGWWNNVEKNCNFNGLCRPECRETVNAVRQHPCMTSDMKDTIEYFLGRGYEGALLLARLSSCSGDQCPAQCPDNCDGWTDVRDKAEFVTVGVISLVGAVVSALVLGSY